jgi:transglutaminase-like putative cysteine protease
MLAGWVALISWSGMVAEPVDFLVPTLFVGVAMALAGSWLRVLRTQPYVVALGQVLVALLSLNLLFAARESLLAVIPTEASVRRVIYVINNGAATLNTYSAPVEVNPTHTRAMLMACGLAVLLSIDILAMGLRRPPLIALPLLVTLSVPVSILRDALALPVFVGTALLFLRLLATENLDRFRGWGGGSDGRRPGVDDSASERPVLSTLWQVSIAAVVVSLLAAPLVPVTDLLDRNRGGEGSAGGGSGYQLTAVNPFIRLRRDLVERTHTPLVYAETESTSTSYLRTTVLDEFTDDAWEPSPRQLPRENSADGVFPNPPGLAPGLGGTEEDWSLQLAPNFTTTWLPLPYPIRDLDVPGTWRYDSRTLDVAYVGGGAASQLRYRTTAYTPNITAEVLESTVRAPVAVRRPMTRLPGNLPEVIRTRAREVTQGAGSDFEKAVALQDWFRQDGGFVYSLEQRSGSGMDLLASFVTDDRVGYCEQFAAAMAAMGRALDIPSRVVVGFLNGTAQPDGRILYTSDDRHAWPEMYFSGVGWVRFEPTPSARAGATPAWTRQSGAAVAPSTAPSAAPSQGTAPEPDQAPTDSSADDGQGYPVPSWPVTSLLVVLVLGLAPGLVRRIQRRRRLRASDPVHLVEGAWAELRATAVDLGLDWPELRSPREQARSVVGQVQAEDDDLHSLEGLLVRVEQGRYARDTGVVTVDADVRARTVETVDAWRKVMVGSVDRERGWRGRLWPLSVVSGGLPGMLPAGLRGRLRGGLARGLRRKRQ